MAETWDETKPSGSRNPVLGDDDIREFKRAMRERLAVDHEFSQVESPAFGNSGSVIGLHKKTTFNQQNSDPTVAADSGSLYGKEVGATCELFWKNENGNVYQLTSGGKLIIAPSLAKGGEIILDTDGDTSITADTDDQIDIKIGGADQLALKDGVIEPSTDNDLDIGSSTKNLKSLFLKGSISINGIAQGKDITTALHRKIVNIGDWNMDSTPAVDISHGLTVSKIRSVSAIIRDDASTTLYPIGMNRGISASGISAQVQYIDASYVRLDRVPSGLFDNTSFDSTGYNRGWIIIDYVD